MAVEYIYKCDYCGEKVLEHASFFKNRNFKSREYNIEFGIKLHNKEICVPCAKKAIIDIGQQFLTDKVTGKEKE